jgi:peptide subunit release factor RF-3
MRVIRGAIDFLLTLGSLQNQMVGMTGNIQIDSSGRRSHFKLDIVEYFRGKFQKVGWWETGQGANRTQTKEEKEQEIQKSLQDKIFIVASRTVSPVIKPFVSLASLFVCPPVQHTGS